MINIIIIIIILHCIKLHYMALHCITSATLNYSNTSAPLHYRNTSATLRYICYMIVDNIALHLLLYVIHSLATSALATVRVHYMSAGARCTTLQRQFLICNAVTHFIPDRDLRLQFSDHSWNCLPKTFQRNFRTVWHFRFL